MAWPIPSVFTKTPYALTPQPGASTGALTELEQLRRRTDEWADVVADFGATGNGVTNDTAAVQAALDQAKYVWVPDGAICVVDQIVGDQENGRLSGGTRGQIRSSGAATDTIVASGDFFTLTDLFVTGGDGTQSIIKTTGFRNLLANVTATGTGQVHALHVDALETQVLLGKFRGGTSAVVLVEKSDCAMFGPYVEQGESHGVEANIGSLNLVGVHSFGNGEHGFRLVGASSSQLSQCYADSNGHRGFDISSSTQGLNLVDCWGFRSSSQENGHADFNFNDAHKIHLFGCRSSGAPLNGHTKGGSFRFIDSDVSLFGCYAEDAPVDEVYEVFYTHCDGALALYNLGGSQGQTAAISIANGATASNERIYLPTRPMQITPGLHAFDVIVKWRRNDNTDGGVDRFQVVVADSVSGVPAVTDTTPGGAEAVSLSGAAVLDDSNRSALELDIANIAGASISVSVLVNDLRTGRGSH